VQIWLEAEATSQRKRPMVVANDARASGGKYLWVPIGTNSGGFAAYKVTIPKSGTYVVWGRVIANNGQEDSFYVQMDNGARFTWHTKRGDKETWVWDQVTNGSKTNLMRFTLTAGTHTLHIGRRENGTKLDKLLITNDLAFVPTEQGTSVALVDLLHVSTGKPYQLATAVLGAQPYIDRTYEITELSPELDGGVLVQVANTEDKLATANEHLRLRIRQDAKVYVAYDPRARRLPAWLADTRWTETDASLHMSDSWLPGSMRVFVTETEAGKTLTLGANRAGGATGASTHYNVIIQPI
jgi:hypothetical protein